MDRMDTDVMEGCRTCGVFYLISSNFLRKIFNADAEEPDMTLIRMELASWNVLINENDGYPQYICKTCIMEFQNVFKFRRSCLSIQQDFRHLYEMRLKNIVKIETPAEEPQEEMTTFIYVDELSNGEYDGTTPFNIPHIPIKMEVIESATIPSDTAAFGEGVAISDITATTNLVNNAFESNGLANISLTEKQNCIEKGGSPKFLMNQAESASVISQQNIDSSSLHCYEEISNMQSSEEENILSHSETSHQSESSFKDIPALQNNIQCSFCLHASHDSEEHRNHLYQVHEMKDLECHICGKVFKNSTTARLKFHMRWHRLSKHLKCAQCGFFCQSKDILNEHTRAVHTKIRCNQCGKQIFAKKIKSHMRGHEIKDIIPCTYCNKVFYTENDLNDHQKIHAIEQSHIQEEAINICNIICMHCQKNFTSHDELHSHILGEHKSPSRGQQLSQCEESNFVNYGEFETSADAIVVSSMESTQNSQMSSVYFDPSLPTLDGETEEECDVPIEEDIEGNSFSNYTMDNLSFLSNANSDDSNHFWDTTNDDLKSSSTISANVSDAKLFGCSKCAALFSTLVELKEHQTQHYEKLVFKCNYCEKSFAFQFTLNRHMKKHRSTQ